MCVCLCSFVHESRRFSCSVSSPRHSKLLCSCVKCAITLLTHTRTRTRTHIHTGQKASGASAVGEVTGSPGTVRRRLDFSPQRENGKTAADRLGSSENLK